MEKKRSFKIIAIAVLLIAVIGLSLGFAAFSQNLVIKAKATTSQNNNMYIYFASQD